METIERHMVCCAKRYSENPVDHYATIRPSRRCASPRQLPVRFTDRLCSVASLEWNLVQIQPSTPAAPTITVWGQAGDIPLVGAYNFPSVTNYSVWRPSEGLFYILGVNTPSQALAVGLPGEIPIFGNFTYPQAWSDLATWDPSSGNWFVDPTLQSGDNYPFEKQWGLPGDVPIAGDFNGDGLTDYAVWRPTESNLYVMLNASGATYVQALGVVGNIPFYGQPPLTNYTPTLSLTSGHPA